MGTQKPNGINPGKFRKLTPLPVKGYYYRSVFLKHQNEILSTQSSLKHGGRYNPRGEFGALYVGENEAVCRAEVSGRIENDFAAPQIISKLKISLAKVLDLTKPANLKALNIKKEDLTINRTKGGWDLTHNIARIAYRDGYEAIIAPAVTGKGNSLVIFDKHIDTARINAASKTHV